MIASTNIGANSAMLEGELALHAHGDLLLEIGENLHRWVGDLLRRDVLPKKSAQSRKVLLGNSSHGGYDGLGVPVQGGHGGR